jgi:hypothetical protein
MVAKASVGQKKVCKKYAWEAKCSELASLTPSIVPSHAITTALVSVAYRGTHAPISFMRKKARN